MKYILLVLLSLILSIGCGRKGDSGAMEGGLSSRKSQASPSLARKSDDKKSSLKQSPTSSVDIAKVKRDSLQQDLKTPLEPTEADDATPKKLVVYKADYYITVQDVKETVSKLEGLINEVKGFIDKLKTSDSYKRAHLILRVPVQQFDSVIAQINKLGIVDKKVISAQDVTEQFQDIQLRLESSKKILSRLKDLLAGVKDPEERIKVLKEIERLVSRIESMESQMKHLLSSANYSTIVIELKTFFREDQKKYIPSPFPWIQELNPDHHPSYDLDSLFQFKNPGGYFLMKEKYIGKKSKYLLESPGNNAHLRLGTAKNYPLGDLTFWLKAVKTDCLNRKYQLIKEINITKESNASKTFSGYVFKISFARYYLIAISVKGDQVYIAEGLFKSDKVYQSQQKKIEAFINALTY